MLLESYVDDLKKKERSLKSGTMLRHASAKLTLADGSCEFISLRKYIMVVFAMNLKEGGRCLGRL